MFHTVYDSWEAKPNGRDYIGKHSSDNPYDSYLGSFKDKTFQPDNKIVIAYSTTAEGAVWLEQRFQRVFCVVEDPQYVNRSYQTDAKFIYGVSGEDNPAKREESRIKISQAKTGVPRPDLTEKNLRDNPAKKPEAAAKIAESRRGKPLSDQAKQKVSEYQLGRPKSEETKRKMKEARKRQKPPTLGLKRWVNEKGEKKMAVESPGPEWQNGRVWRG
jgi:hypothetical protein